METRKASFVAPPRRLSASMQELREDILAELVDTDWSGTSLTTLNVRNGADASERDAVNIEGIGHGCHDCGSKLATDPDQPWIGDHIPPWNLSTAVRRHFGLGDRDDTWLVPSCGECSSLQSALVIRLNNMGALPAASTLSAREQRMLGIGDAWRAYDPVRATGARVNQAQGQHVQRIGVGQGCHICPNRVPHTRYIADHNPPTEFNTPGMARLLKHLDIALPAEVVLKAHCVRCSSAQGGRMVALMRRIDAAIRDLGMSTGRVPRTPWKFRDQADEPVTVRRGRPRARSASPERERPKRERSRDYDRGKEKARRKGDDDD